MRSVESYHYAAALSTERHLFSHCHYIYCDSQNDDKSQSEKQIDIESLPLDEIAEAIASLPMILKIHPVLMYHGISQDNTLYEYKHPDDNQG